MSPSAACSLRTEAGGVHTGSLRFGDDLGRPRRRRPADHADADRVRDDDARLALRGLREIVQAQRREVDDDAFRGAASGSTNCVGSTMRVPSPGSQGSTPGFACHQLVVAEVEAARDVRERVLVMRVRGLQLADDAGGLRVEREQVRRERFGEHRLAAAAGGGPGGSFCGMNRLQPPSASTRPGWPACRRSPADTIRMHRSHPVCASSGPRRSEHGGPVRQFVLVAAIGQRREMHGDEYRPRGARLRARRPRNRPAWNNRSIAWQTSAHSFDVTRSRCTRGRQRSPRRGPRAARRSGRRCWPSVSQTPSAANTSSARAPRSLAVPDLVPAPATLLSQTGFPRYATSRTR